MTSSSKSETQLKRSEAMINSMTVAERRDPDWQVRLVADGGLLVDLALRKRINKLVADFQKMRSLMQQMGQGNFPVCQECSVWAIPQQLE